MVAFILVREPKYLLACNQLILRVHLRTPTLLPAAVGILCPKAATRLESIYCFINNTVIHMKNNMFRIKKELKQFPWLSSNFRAINCIHDYLRLFVLANLNLFMFFSSFTYKKYSNILKVHFLMILYYYCIMDIFRYINHL